MKNKVIFNSIAILMFIFQYRKPDKTYKDVRRLLGEYKDLQPKLGGKGKY